MEFVSSVIVHFIVRCSLYAELCNTCSKMSRKVIFDDFLFLRHENGVLGNFSIGTMEKMSKNFRCQSTFDGNWREHQNC